MRKPQSKTLSVSLAIVPSINIQFCYILVFSLNKVIWKTTPFNVAHKQKFNTLNHVFKSYLIHCIKKCYFFQSFYCSPQKSIHLYIFRKNFAMMVACSVCTVGAAWLMLLGILFNCCISLYLHNSFQLYTLSSQIS